MARNQDFLDEIVAERSESNPGFPEMVEAAYERRRLLHDIVVGTVVINNPVRARMLREAYRGV